LLLIGNDWKKKGLDTLLKALTLLSDLPLRLLVVGNDDPSFYRPLLDRLGLQNRTRFEKPSSDVLSFYAVADLYIGPSLEDAFNLPILEAMACGLPVIASANAGASELIRDGETGFILRDPHDHLQLASLISRIQAESWLRVSMGAAASHYLMTNYSWDDNAERTRELLEGILSSSRI
jgi:UDP-glucose:(heptosyl)LPS alpha-1,3-glucosyltransferase